MRSYLIIVCATLVCCSLSATGQTDNELVISALKKNDPVALVSCFHTMVDLQIPGFSGSFSKNQASVIVKKFLADQPVGSVSITREDNNSDGSKYVLGELAMGGKKYRLYFVTRETGGKQRVLVFKITEL
ncbi:MAG: DUF4783 domain-containing protein [Bacteroidia bacterium]|nr:DUF4783 domain-containing protein [Bacteroidia bacterium]